MHHTSQAACYKPLAFKGMPEVPSIFSTIIRQNTYQLNRLLGSYFLLNFFLLHFSTSQNENVKMTFFS